MELSREIKQHDLGRVVGSNREQRLVAHRRTVARLQSLAVESHAAAEDLQPGVATGGELVRDLSAFVQVDRKIRASWWINSESCAASGEATKSQLVVPFGFGEAFLLVAWFDAFLLRETAKSGTGAPARSRRD